MTETTWKGRIENLIANPQDEACAADARHLASSWRTCGVGEARLMLQAKGYEFDEAFSPTDPVLKSLADRFHGFIDHGRYERAMETLHEIEGLGPCDVSTGTGQ